MNKLLIVLLVVCLVSVHAFVKRDAPEAPKTNNDLEDLQKKFEDFGKSVSDQFKGAFDAEKLKEGFNDVISKINKAVEGMNKPAAESKS